MVEGNMCSKLSRGLSERRVEVLLSGFEPKDKTTVLCTPGAVAEKGPLPFLICLACYCRNLPLPPFSCLVPVPVSTVIGASVPGSLPFPFCVLWQAALHVCFSTD